MRGKNKILITCSKGIAPLLREEVLSEGFPIVEESVAGIITEGTLDDTMRLNLFIRTGQRVLFLVGEFDAVTADELYRGVSKITWENMIPEDGYLSVASNVSTPLVRDSMYANVKCKDAIVDRMAGRFGRRPDSGPRKDRTVVHLSWRERECSVWLDTSGEPLSKRGYRKKPLEAPMQETLAAAVVLSTGWDDSGNFLNPMCGSGTLAVEAALIGLRRAPGVFRTNFGFMHLKGYDKSLWERMRADAVRRARSGLTGRVLATDVRREAVDAARENAVAAGVGHILEFDVCDYSMSPVPPGGGVVVINPEYGLRMGRTEELGEVYRGIGDFFKQKCGGYKGFVFTGNPELSKAIGLRSRKRTQFYNGEVECRLIEFELYAGSRKQRTDDAPPGREDET